MGMKHTTNLLFFSLLSIFSVFFREDMKNLNFFYQILPKCNAANHIQIFFGRHSGQDMFSVNPKS
jgi:hypothetical protein